METDVNKDDFGRQPSAGRVSVQDLQRSPEQSLSHLLELLTTTEKASVFWHEFPFRFANYLRLFLE